MTGTRPLLRIATGVALGLLALFLGLMLAGAGHGWVSSFFFSMILPLAYPAVLMRDTAPARSWLPLDLLVVAVAIAADIGLMLSTMQEVESAGLRVLFFPGDPLRVLITALWLLLWLGWQLVALRCVLRDLRRA